MTGGVTVQSTTVDGAPTARGPASTTTSTNSPSAATAASAVVGAGWPLRLALEAATGTPAADNKASATGCRGTRIPTVPAAPRRGRIRVSGPGQNRRANSSAAEDHSTGSWRAASTVATCRVSNFSTGRAFASYSRATAAASSAWTPTP